MSDEEYARLLGLVRGAQGGEHRFPPGAYEAPERMSAVVPEAVSALASSSNAALSSSVKVKATSLEGVSATDRMRIGTLRLPEGLLERIRLVLKGTLHCHLSFLPPSSPCLQRLEDFSPKADLLKKLTVVVPSVSCFIGLYCD